MDKKILIDANFLSETRVVLLDKNNNIEDVEYSSTSKKQIKGNIYLAKVTRVEPALQAAFIDYGDEKSGFLPFAEIHPDYYNLLVKDKVGTPSWHELTPAEITSDDLAENKSVSVSSLIDSDEIDISKIEKLVEEKIQLDIDLEAEDNEIEKFSKETYDATSKGYKIQEVIKKGQILLVQVTKEERGNKGVSLTSYISLAGKYCVLMPNKPLQNGVSRKISSHDERKRLKDIIDNLCSDKVRENSSIIARTAAIGHTSLEIKKDFEYLAKLWNKIRDTTLKAQAPCFIHQEDGLILKTVRDMFDRNVKEIIVQGGEAHASCERFIKEIMPHSIGSLKEYKSSVPIFTKYNVEDQLTKLYQPIAALPSGGYIVINPTEALISIDVNSGKATSERNIEEMAVKTNLEAAREIAKQVKMRDLSGLLVIDFIDMSESKNRRIVERSFKEFLSRDKARIQTSSISNFGLLEMSRQRLRPSFLEINSNICSHCSGKGIVRAEESNAMLILRTVENEIFQGKYDMVNVYGIAGSIIYLLNNKREEIKLIEKKYSVKLNFMIDHDATADSYSVEKIKLASKNKAENINKQKPALQSQHDIYLGEELQQDIPNVEEVEKEKITRNKRRKRKQAVGKPNATLTSSAEGAEAAEDVSRTTEANLQTAAASELTTHSQGVKPEPNLSEARAQKGKNSNNRPRKKINRRKVALKTNAAETQINEN